MASFRTQSWITYATLPEHVLSAQVLAKSLRQQFTTRRIGIIVSTSLSPEDLNELKMFDDVHYLPPAGKTYHDGNELSGKIYAFHLGMFEKCVLLEPNSVFMENLDFIFEREHGQLVDLLDEKEKFAGDYVLIIPSPRFSDYLVHQLKTSETPEVRNFLRNSAQNWTDADQQGHAIFGDLFVEKDQPLGKIVAQFSLDNGELLNWESYGMPGIVQFVQGPTDPSSFVERMKKLHEECCGLLDKTIVGMWLDVKNAIPNSGVPPTVPVCQMLPNEPIAIVGMSCRLPGANNLDEFWKLLLSGESAIRPPPSFRWKKKQVVTPVGEKELKTQAGFLATSVDEFDAKFFGLSPREAVFMDPQTRLMHEVLWESLESAGIDPTTLQGTHTGIFTGSWLHDYRDIVQCSTTRDFFRTYMGTGIGAGAARLSFLLGLTGPSVATESGCSSAMVAVDMAVRSLRCGETKLALAGGVNLLLHPFTSQVMEYVIAPDGRCKTFDAKADGFGRAEGCGFLVLKRLSDALRDRDHIWALIRGSATAQEGLSRSLGTPTVHGEALAMKLALKNGGVRPEQVSHIECHGSATRLGDPMEVKAIALAYHTPNRKEPLVIGSGKTNVGHTESCSGITGIIKTVLSLQNELIPRHLNLETLNPEVDLEAIPAQIPLEPREWPRIAGQPRLAGVSSFGITGTDGHVIIEEAPDFILPQITVGMERPLHLMKISAQTKDALDQMLEKYPNALNVAEEKWADVAHTANVGRASFEHRAFLLANGIPSAVENLENGSNFRGMVAEKGDICFLFPGQGSQYPGMGQTFYETSPVFRFHFDKCDALLRTEYELDLKRVLWGDRGEQINRTIYSQTSIFVVEYCLLKLWDSWGIQPNVVVGHSLGEYCAAVCAGLVTFRQAINLVAERSRLIEGLPRGSMLVVKADQKLVREIMASEQIRVDIAALNSANQTVVAGNSEIIQSLHNTCTAKGIKSVILEGTHAFHSAHMDAMLPRYGEIAKEMDLGRTSSCQFISGMEGVIRDKVDADYWIRHTRDPVNFIQTCETLGKLGVRCCVEVGAQPVLSAFVLKNLAQVTCHPSLRKGTGEWNTILNSLGELWISGYPVNWQGYDKPYNRNKVDVLPFYPFQRKRFWVNCTDQGNNVLHPLLGSPLRNASTDLRIFQTDLTPDDVPYLKDHCIGNKILFPGAAFTEMLLAAGHAVSSMAIDSWENPCQTVVVKNVKIVAPLELKEDSSTRFQVLVTLPKSEDRAEDVSSCTPRYKCQLFHRNATSNKWIGHASADFYASGETASSWDESRVRELISEPEAALPIDTFYKQIDAVGLKFGPAFHTIQRSWSVPQNIMDVDEVVAQVEAPPAVDDYLIHPTLLDAMFQVQVLAGAKRSKWDSLRVPVGVNKLVVHTVLGKEHVGKPLYIYAHWQLPEQHYTLSLCTDQFQLVAQLEGALLLNTNVKTIFSMLEGQNNILPDCWEETWKPIPNGPHENSAPMGNILVAAVSSPELSAQLKAINDQEGMPPGEIADVDRLVTLYAFRALLELGWKPKAGLVVNAASLSKELGIHTAHLQQLVYFYFTAIKDELRLIKRVKGNRWRVDNVQYATAEQVNQELEPLHQRLLQGQRTATVAKIYAHVGTSLPQVLRGKMSGLLLLFPAESDTVMLGAEQYYQHYPARQECIGKTRLILSALSRKWQKNLGEIKDTAVLRLLEVGAGTGSMTVDALATIKTHWESRFEYYYTDISSSFFMKAEMRLEEYKGQVKFVVFNIEEHPLSQGIPVNFFNWILCSDVLHATRDLRECLANLRLTLKPGGLLTFTETVRPDKGITSVFGLLEGYWRFQDKEIRPHHACVSNQIWKKLLLETGFDHVNVTPFYEGTMSIVSAEASNFSGYDQFALLAKPKTSLARWLLFLPKEDSVDHEIMLRVADVLRGTGSQVKLVYPSKKFTSEESAEQEVSQMLCNNSNNNEGDVPMNTGIIYAWGMTLKHQAQTEIALPLLYISKTLMNTKESTRLYVITKNVHAHFDEICFPDAATLWGMVKCLKNENRELFVRCVDLSSQGLTVEHRVDQILHELALYRESREKGRTQVMYRGLQRLEPKFSRVETLPKSQSDLQLPVCSSGRYRLQLPSTRLIDDLQFKPLELPMLQPGEEVEVEVRAYALNFRDILAILKPSTEFESINTVGLDFAGVVSRVPKEEASWRVGDPVLGVNLKETPMYSHLSLKSQSIFRIPPGISFNEACTLPAVYATSIHCLITVAQLQPGETVLIHTGSGGVGLSAIHVARHLGANVITTAGSRRKRNYLQKKIGLDLVYHSRDTSYEQNILTATNGRGVDVVLNSLTGAGFKEATLNCCARDARFCGNEQAVRVDGSRSTGATC